MLVLHCMMVVKVGTCGSSLASSHTSRARLVSARFGITTPQTPKSIGPRTRAAMACTTGTDKVSESRCANGPSTPAKGVRTPAASQMDILRMLLLRRQTHVTMKHLAEAFHLPTV